MRKTVNVSIHDIEHIASDTCCGCQLLRVLQVKRFVDLYASQVETVVKLECEYCGQMAEIVSLRDFWPEGGRS